MLTARPDLRVPADYEAFYAQSLEEGWGDGLPLVPPTEERVAAALGFTDRDPEDVVAVVPPERGDATVLKVAVNAVMAGCPAACLPVVIAAVEAACAPQVNLESVQVTTNPAGLAGFVSGPAAGALGFNAAGNCLGQGNRANATVGRALRLVLTNLGGGSPGSVDRATQGQPAKHGFFFAENQAASPWPSHRADLGFGERASTVTVIALAGTLNLLETSDDAEDILHAFAVSARAPNGNDYMFGGQPWFVLCPEHAAALAHAGHDKGSVRKELWRQSRVPVSDFSASTLEYRLRNAWGDSLGELVPDALVPLSRAAEDIGIVIAGGAGRHSQFLPSFGITRSATTAITDRRGDPIEVFG